METSHVLSASVTPAVLISACGLVTLALYHRLGASLARIRALHRKKFELLENLHKHEGVEQQMLVEMLDSQIVQVTAKARMVKHGLFCLLGSIAAFLLCSLFAGATQLYAGVGIIALVLGIFAILLFLVGVGWAMRELILSLTPLDEETTYLDVFRAQQLAKLRNGKPLKIAESA